MLIGNSSFINKTSFIVKAKTLKNAFVNFNGRRYENATLLTSTEKTMADQVVQ